MIFFIPSLFFLFQYEAMITMRF